MKKPDWLPMDDYGLIKIPLRFYWLLLLLLRPYLCWVVALTMPQQNMLALFYPEQHDFMLSCIVALPVLLVFAAFSQRKPSGQRGWRLIWRYSRWLLLLVALADAVLTINDLPPQVMLDVPWRIVAPIALLLAIGWLCRSRMLPLVFAEWPEPVAKK